MPVSIISDVRKNPEVSNGQLPSLTSLRGLAALWVVVYHFSVQCLPSLDATHHTQLIHKGYLAVDMFFLLSGFVMTHVYHGAFSQSVARNYRSFIVARIARLYPLHVLMLFMFVATAVAAQFMAGVVTVNSIRDIPLQGSESVSAFIANIFMLQGLDAGKLSWNYPAWSISVEFMAYLAFPFALPAIWRAPNGIKLALGALLFGLLAVLALLTRDNFDQWNGPITLLRCMPEFVLGTLLYWVFRAGGNIPLIDRDAAAWIIVAAAILCLHVGAPDILVTVIFAALILVTVRNTGVFAKIANAAPLIWLGDISYSLYLIHGFIQFVATKLLAAAGVNDHAVLSKSHSLALIVVMIGVCLVAANVSYFGVEIGCRHYLRDLLGARRKGPNELVLFRSR